MQKLSSEKNLEKLCLPTVFFHIPVPPSWEKWIHYQSNVNKFVSFRECPNVNWQLRKNWISHTSISHCLMFLSPFTKPDLKYAKCDALILKTNYTERHLKLVVWPGMRNTVDPEQRKHCCIFRNNRTEGNDDAANHYTSTDRYVKSSTQYFIFWKNEYPWFCLNNSRHNTLLSTKSFIRFFFTRKKLNSENLLF